MQLFAVSVYLLSVVLWYISSAQLAMMMRPSKVALAFSMKYKRNSGLYDEDHVNGFDARSYTPARTMLQWYAKMELLATRSNLSVRQITQSEHQRQGRHHTGTGPFERELERKGIPVEKYNLTTTTGASRVREMVVLRRKALDAKSEAAIKEQREAKRQALPSAWYDETAGPLNPKFLKAIQPQYSVNITDLPRTPLSYTTWSSQHAVGTASQP